MTWRTGSAKPNLHMPDPPASRTKNARRNQSIMFGFKGRREQVFDLLIFSKKQLRPDFFRFL